MVISQKMIKSEMDYRGSKSVPNNVNFTGTAKINNNNVLGVVKEQRVDGSWLHKQAATCRSLRCTLMGFERNYQIRILSQELYKKGIRFYSTTPLLPKEGGNLLNVTSLNP